MEDSIQKEHRARQQPLKQLYHKLLFVLKPSQLFGSRGWQGFLRIQPVYDFLQKDYFLLNRINQVAYFRKHNLRIPENLPPPISHLLSSV